MAKLKIQSTCHPPERLSFVDWELYLKVKSMRKVNLARRLNDKLNQVLSQTLTSKTM